MAWRYEIHSPHFDMNQTLSQDPMGLLFGKENRKTEKKVQRKKQVKKMKDGIRRTLFSDFSKYS